MLQLSEGYWAGKPRLVRLLADLEASGQCQQTIYLTPGSLESRRSQLTVPPTDLWEDRITSVLSGMEKSETGVVMFMGDERTVAVAPPFPLAEDTIAEGAETSPLARLLSSDLLIGVVLLRLGRYAIGVLRGDSLVATKTGSRYVKGRHRAGGSSQRRFERSRERLVRELFDKTCQVTRDVYSPYGKAIDYVLMGGERQTLLGFVRRCDYLKAYEPRILQRVLTVNRPGQKALERVGFEVWKSRVSVFNTVDEA